MNESMRTKDSGRMGENKIIAQCSCSVEIGRRKGLGANVVSTINWQSSSSIEFLLLVLDFFDEVRLLTSFIIFVFEDNLEERNLK